PRSPAVIMLFTALPPPPPTPNTQIRGLSSVMSGFLRLIVIVLSFAFLPPSPLRPFRALPAFFLETVSQPLTHALKRAPGSGHARLEACPALVALEVGELGIDQQPDRGREGRTLGRLRQPGDAERAPDPDVAAKHAP